MATSDEQVQLLDQLQTEINRVFVQCGQLFKAASSGGKGAAAAHAVRLKRDVPGSINRFHDALDQLEAELQLAQTVFRRDLARSRQQNAEKISEPTGSVTIEPEAVTGQASKSEEASTSPDKVAKNLDVEMKDIETDQQPEEASAVPTSKLTGKPTEPKGEAMSSEATERIDSAIEMDSSITKEEHPDKQGPKADQKPTVENLEINTSLPSKAEPEDMPPDTAITSDTRDLESLFGPQSAGPGTAADDFQQNGENAGDAFDFGSFDAGGGHGQLEDADDNITSLLPGLQDYANTRPNTADAELEALFGEDTDAAGGAENGQGNGQNFDDFMDFSSFNADDLGAAGGNGTQDYMQELNFD